MNQDGDVLDIQADIIGPGNNLLQITIYSWNCLRRRNLQMQDRNR